MSFVANEIARNKEEHNAKVAQCKAIEAEDYAALSEEDRNAKRDDLMAAYARIDELKAEREKLEAELQREVSPVSHDTVTANLTKDAEAKLAQEELIRRDPFSYWEQNNLPPIEQRDQQGHLMSLPGGADLVFGQASRRLTAAPEGGFKYELVNTAAEVQEQGRPGIGMYAPPLAHRGLLSVVGQVEVPNNARVFTFLRGDEVTDGATQTAEGAAFTRSRIDFDVVETTVRQTGTWHKVSRGCSEDKFYLHAVLG